MKLLTSTFMIVLVFNNLYSQFNYNLIKNNSNNEKEYGTLIDNEGNHYKTILLGGQEWMAENLRVKSFNNGDNILEFTRDKNDVLGIPACFDLSKNPKEVCGVSSKNYEENLGDVYYTMNVIIDDRNVCPSGWHVPDLNEWEDMLVSLGGIKKEEQLRVSGGWADLKWFERKNLANDLKAAKLEHRYIDIWYSKSGGSHETTWVTCNNCKNWNSEYRSKKECNVCKDNRGFEKKGNYVPMTFKKNEFERITYSGHDGSNNSGFNLINSGYLHRETCVFLQGVSVWANGLPGGNYIKISQFEDDKVSIIENDIDTFQTKGRIIRCIKD